MHRRKLGPLEVSAIGLGCMTMSPYYGEPDEASAIATIRAAPDLGIDLIDTSDAYGKGDNEELVGRAIAPQRHRYIIATKFGNFRFPDGSRGENGRPDYVPQACDASLNRLGIETIDIYYLHRVDPAVPIEDTIGAMARLVEAGKVRFLGVSETSAKTLRRAHAVHPIAALQSEYSLWTRDVEPEILPTCEELGVGFVAYSPMGRGFLTGEISSPDALGASDARRSMPRFQGSNFESNRELVDRLQRLATENKCTPAQLALAWLLTRSQSVVPIPGTTNPKRLAQNAASAAIDLSGQTRAVLEEIFPPGAAAGTRVAESLLARLAR